MHVYTFTFFVLYTFYTYDVNATITSHKGISEWNLFLNDKNHVGHSLNIHNKGSTATL